MGKKQRESGSTIENRVYLFRELAAAFLEDNGETLVGTDAQREKAMRALGDLAHAACVVADHGHLDGRRVGDMVARGHRHGVTKTQAPAKKAPAKKAPTKKAAKKSATKRATKKTTKKATKKKKS